MGFILGIGIAFYKCLQYLQSKAVEKPHEDRFTIYPSVYL